MNNSVRFFPGFPLQRRSQYHDSPFYQVSPPPHRQSVQSSSVDDDDDDIRKHEWDRCAKEKHLGGPREGY